MTQLVLTHDIPSHPRIAAALAKIPSLLTAGEDMACVAVQLPFTAYAALSRRQIVVATNQRLILVTRGLFGGFVMRDVQWQDLIDARIEENSFTGLKGCEFVAHTRRGDFVAHGLPAAPAFNLYRICQQREQEWREKNRVREMEEARARAGGTSLLPLGRGGAGPAVADLTGQLQQLQQLRHAGTISDVEFETMKAKIFAGL